MSLLPSLVSHPPELVERGGLPLMRHFSHMEKRKQGPHHLWSIFWPELCPQPQVCWWSNLLRNSGWLCGGFASDGFSVYLQKIHTAARSRRVLSFFYLTCRSVICRESCWFFIHIYIIVQFGEIYDVAVHVLCNPLSFVACKFMACCFIPIDHTYIRNVYVIYIRVTCQTCSAELLHL